MPRRLFAFTPCPLMPVGRKWWPVAICPYSRPLRGCPCASHCDPNAAVAAVSMRISLPPSPHLPLTNAVPTQDHRPCWFGFCAEIRTNRGDGLELVLRWYDAGQAPRSLGRIRGSYTWVRRGEWLPFFSRPVATWRAASRLSPCRVLIIPFLRRGYPHAPSRFWACRIVAAA